jgi:hypothetical protein
MQTINISGLARASAALVVWPLVDEQGAPIANVIAAKLRLNSTPAQELTLGAGLSFVGGEVSADLTNTRTEDLTGAVAYELWIQIGPDKLAAVGGTLNFTNTIARI